MWEGFHDLVEHVVLIIVWPWLSKVLHFLLGPASAQSVSGCRAGLAETVGVYIIIIWHGGWGHGCFLWRFLHREKTRRLSILLYGSLRFLVSSYILYDSMTHTHTLSYPAGRGFGCFPRSLLGTEIILFRSRLLPLPPSAFTCTGQEKHTQVTIRTDYMSRVFQHFGPEELLGVQAFIQSLQ